MAKLKDAIAKAIVGALERTTDRATRVEVPKTWPVAQALDLVSRHPLGAGLRVGVLRPFRLKPFQRWKFKVSDSPSGITRWRNTKNRAWPLVVCGRADVGGSEGLKDFALLLKREQVIACWKELEGDDAARSIGKPEIGALVSRLFDECERSLLDAVDLDEYLSAIGSLAPSQISSVYSEMWRARLIPDDQALDKGASGRRLQVNLLTISRLESEEDEKTRKLLRRAAKEQGPRMQSAKAALQFGESGDKTDLKSATLAQILAILGERETGPAVERTKDLTELLNLCRTQSDMVASALRDLETQWRIDDPDCLSLETSIDLDGGSRFRVGLQPSVQEVRDDDGAQRLEFDRPWLGDAEGDQVLVACLDVQDPTAFDRADAWTKRSIDQFRAVLQAHDEPEAAAVVDAFEGYVAAREAMRVYEAWLDKNSFELLTISASARDSVNTLLASWEALLRCALRLRSPGKTIRFLQLIDAAWGPDLEEPHWAVLGPLHPYRLDPVRRVAEQVATEIARQRAIALGDASDWLLDRCYPAYPAIYCADRSLHLSRTENELVYMDQAQEHLPRADEGSGLGHCIECLEGFAPQLSGGLLLLLIDPPLGRAVNKQIQRLIDRLGDKLTVFVAVTRPDASALEELDGNVNYVGRFDDLGEWVTRTNSAVHVTVRFVTQPKGTVAARHGWSATRGSFLAPHLEVSLDPLAADDVTPVAEVKIEPREGNGVVCLAHDLYRKNTGNIPKHFQFRPLLGKHEIDALKGLAGRTDWLIVGAPGPMGIATPSRINTSLSFVGRDVLGPYGLYAYATDGLFTVRRFIEHALREVPVNVVPEKVADRLASLAKQSGAAILRMGKDGIDEHQASLVALRRAHEDDTSGRYLDVVLRVDDLGWTRIWINDPKRDAGAQRRCDFLLVRIAQEDGISPRVVVRAVESKSDVSSVPLEPLPSVPSFAEGCLQVEATLNSLAEVFFPIDTATLDQDVRFSTFIEHLMAAVLSTDPDFDDLPRLKRSVATLNALSARAMKPTEVLLEGYVVVTQSGTNADAASKTHVLESGFPLTLARATAKALSVLFGGERGDIRHASGDFPVDQNSGTGHDLSARGSEDGGEAQDVGGEDAMNSDEPSPEVVERRVGDSQWADQIAQDLVLICERHQIPIADREPSRVLLGPALVSVAVRLKVGAQLDKVEKRLEDLMRDIGLGERANEVSVMNDTEASTIRFLIPRPNREFPPLPPDILPIEWDGTYLPIRIGRTLEGRDYVSTVENWPHMLIAGTTGSGKTTFLRTLLKQCSRFGPDAVQLIVVDGKGDTDYLDSVPHDMLVPEFPEPLLGHDRANDVLEWAVAEMESRRAKLHDLATRTTTPVALKWPEVFRSQLSAGEKPTIRPVVIVIDEFADLMLASKSQAESFLRNVQRVAQVGRSRMIHLVLATQRPDKETIRGAIKTNLDARVVMRLPTSADSMTVLGHGGAERLLKHGDLLFQSGGSENRLQGYNG